MFLKRKVDSKPKQNSAHLAAILHQFEINVGLGIIYAGIPSILRRWMTQQMFTWMENKELSVSNLLKFTEKLLY